MTWIRVKDQSQGVGTHVVSGNFPVYVFCVIADGEDVFTTELLRRMGQALGCPARLVPVPVSWLKLAAAMVGKQDVA